MEDYWKKKAYKSIEENLNKYNLKEADINIDYQKQEIKMEIKLDMTKFREDDFEIKKPTAKCAHKNTFSYNHGYHTICKDCGEQV